MRCRWLLVLLLFIGFAGCVSPRQAGSDLDTTTASPPILAHRSSEREFAHFDLRRMPRKVRANSRSLLRVKGSCERKSRCRVNRRFHFSEDTFAYANETAWEYRLEPATGRMVAQRREPPASYALRCFAMARSARQFLVQARFAPEEPKSTPATYRHLVRRVLTRNSHARGGLVAPRIVIPGYANLRAFSRDYARLLKAETGGAWQSYCQRGNWRMVFPFSRGHQKRTARRLVESLERSRPPIIHVVRFPALTINHVLLVFDCRKTGRGFEFTAYDPNNPAEPLVLIYDQPSGTFLMPPTRYFAGGRVDVYEIYRNLLY